MAQTLAGSLALVTCKEPLRVACGNHLRSLLQQAGADAQLMEQVVQVCAADNLDLGCTLNEKAATEKAVRDVEEALAPAFAIRRKHREQTGLPYYDMSIFTNGRYPASLPEALRPKPGGLLPAQRRVYEDFGRIPRTAAAMGIVPGQTPGATGVAGAAGVAGQPATGAANPLFAQQAGAGGAYGAAGTQAAQALLGQTGASPARRRHPRLRLGRRAGGDGGGDGRRAAAVGLRRRLDGPAPRRRRGGGRGVGRRRAALDRPGDRQGVHHGGEARHARPAARGAGRDLDRDARRRRQPPRPPRADLGGGRELGLARRDRVGAGQQDLQARLRATLVGQRRGGAAAHAGERAAHLPDPRGVPEGREIRHRDDALLRTPSASSTARSCSRSSRRAWSSPPSSPPTWRSTSTAAATAPPWPSPWRWCTLVLDERAVAADACGDLLSALSQLAKHPSPPRACSACWTTLG